MEEGATCPRSSLCHRNTVIPGEQAYQHIPQACPRPARKRKMKAIRETLNSLGIMTTVTSCCFLRVQAGPEEMWRMKELPALTCAALLSLPPGSAVTSDSFLPSLNNKYADTFQFLPPAQILCGVPLSPGYLGLLWGRQNGRNVTSLHSILGVCSTNRKCTEHILLVYSSKK